MFPGDAFTILPPRNSEELGFDDVRSAIGIEDRLKTIVRHKHEDVISQSEFLQLQQSSCSYSPGDVSPSVLAETELPPLVVVADTTVIATDDTGALQVLGQPTLEHWQDEVRLWFKRFLSGRTHQVWTCFRVSCGHILQEQVIRSRVTFVSLTDAQIDWYISTGESVGKAGGYAIQGYGAALVCGLEGSLTNVIGLPLLEVSQCLHQVEFDARSELSRSRQS